MTDVTKDMLIDYMRRKGGRVKNVDLVKHFRKYLLFEDAIKKERAREDFKEKVNAVAVIKQEQGEKFLYLKENSSSPPLSPPPPVSPPPTAAYQSTALSRITSLHENGDRYLPPTQAKHVNTSLTNGVHNRYQTPSPSSTKPSSPPVVSNAFSAISSISSATQAVDPPTGRRPPPLSPSATQAVDPPPTGRRPPPLSPSATQAFDPPPTGRRPPPLSPSATQTVDPPTGRRPPPLSPPATSVKPQTDFSRRPAPVPPSSKPPSGLMSSRQKPPALSSQPDAQPIGGGRRPAPISPGVQSSGMQSSSLFSPYSLIQTERRPAPAAPPSRTEPSRREPPRPPQRAQRSSEITQTSIVQLDESPGLRRASPPPAPTISTSLGDDSSSFLDQMTSELNSIGSLFPDSNFMIGSKPTTTSSFSSISTSSSSKPSLITSPTHGSPVTKTPPQQPPPTSYSNASLLSPSSPSSSSSLSSTTVPSPSHNPQSVQHLIKQYTPSSGNFPSSPSPRQDLPMASLSVRRESTPPDSHHVHRSHSNAASGVRRRGNLDTLTRRSIQNPGMDRQELMAHRLSKTSDDLHASREALSGVGDSEQGRDSPMSSEDYYEQVDPVEKEWAHALIDGRLDIIHQLILSDVSYINKKGFLNGWTALHWAAKLGSQDMVNVLILSGALVDIKSNGGLTPLHLACEAGNEDVIKTLVREHNASVNARDHSGKRPMDILNNSSTEVAKSLLRNGLRYYTPPTEIPLSSFAISRKSSKPQEALSFNVPHTNLRRHGRQAAIKHVNEKRRGTLSFRKISFRRRKYTVADGKKDRTKSNPTGRYNQARN